MALEATQYIWHNGDLIPWENAKIHVMSHVVTTARRSSRAFAVTSSQAARASFACRSTMSRLVDSAKIYRMPLPYTAEELSDCSSRCDRGQRRDALLHSSHRLPRLRRDRRQSAPLAGRGIHRELPMG